MPVLLQKHGVTFRPEGRLFTLRDRDCQTGEDAGEAVTDAWDNTAASSGPEIYVKVAQDDLPVGAGVEIWDAEPADDLCAQGWLGPVRLLLQCPSGHLILGVNDQSVDGQWLPPETICQVEVFFRGQEEAVAKAEELAEATARLAIPEAIAYQDQHGSGIEQYLLRLWWHATLPGAWRGVEGSELGVAHRR
jgi:hypothetical protein